MVTVYKNLHLLDGTLDMKVQDVMIEVTDKKISAIGNNIDLTGKKVVDLGGRFVTPGLINLHAHLPSSGKPKKKKLGDMSKLVNFICSTKLTRKIGLMLGAKSAKVELFSGVTTVRTVGGVADFDSRLRDLINKGKKVGPRILAANYGIGTADGHMVGTVAKCANTIEEGYAYLEDLKKSNVDLVKLMITGGVLDGDEVGKPGQLKMQGDMINALCKRAHEYGFYVAAHVESPEGIKIAIENGVDSIEHGAGVDQETLKLLKERNGAVVATLSPAIPFIEIDPDITGYGEIAKINSEIIMKGFIDCVSKCLNNGIKVGLGTDTGSYFVTHYNFWRELIFFMQYCHVSANFALHTATEVNAIIARCDKETGTIEVGKCADFVVVDKNPLDDFSIYKNPYMVAYLGKVYKKPKVKKYDVIDSTLDKLIQL